jgi:NADPH:quinone reductase-like Zn-dependent oxidoreductase
MAAMMRAMRVARFGGPEVLEWVEIERPQALAGEILVDVAAAGVGPWDTWVRSGKSVLPQPLPLIPGSDISGTVVEIGPEVSGFAIGDRVFGVTNPRFTNGYAEFAPASADMMARMPAGLEYQEAAALPVIAVTAWQALHDYAQVQPGQNVLVLGGAGNVGALAVQLAHRAQAAVTATASKADLAFVQDIGAQQAIDRALSMDGFQDAFDVIVDTVGGAALAASYPLVRRGGVIVSIVEKPDADRAAQRQARADFMLVAVRTPILESLGQLAAQGELRIRVGDVLPLNQARRAHEMMEQHRQQPGKMLLLPGD